MDEGDLIKKLDEVQECKNTIVKYFRQNLNKVNEIIINSLMPGENLTEPQPFFCKIILNRFFGIILVKIKK
jgi:hypothetical protein